jgi:catechol 2,3-dioxygenase-like lactoylglutathione lyase family enzyme
MPFPSPRRLDHLVLPARDLEAQAAFYRRMGFRVGARNVHPWGTENRLAQFDGCFLELITLPDAAAPPAPAPRRFSFGRHVGDWLRREGDGLSMLAISSPDAKADAEWFRRSGVADYEPFRFGRKGKRPDGGEMEVAFSLAYATPAAMPDLCFFACEQHNPENFWTPAFQEHENGALGVGRVVVVHPRPLEALTFAKAYAGGEPAVTEAGLDLALANGALSIWTPEAARARLGDDPALFAPRSARFGAVVHRVRDIARTNLILKTNNVPHRVEKTRILVPSGAAFGVLTLFEQSVGQGVAA